MQGGEYLANLAPPVILAGTHHAYADFPLVYQALKQTPARELASKIVVAARATAFDAAGPAAWFGTFALGLYPLRQYGDHRDLHRVDRRQRQMCIRDRSPRISALSAPPSPVSYTHLRAHETGRNLV